MWFKLIRNSLLYKRNITALLIVLLSAFVLNLTELPKLIMYFENYTLTGSLLVYMIFVFQSLFSDKFHKNLTQKEKIKQMKDNNKLSKKLFVKAKRVTNSQYLKRLKKVIVDKDEIFKSFFDDDKGVLKEKIALQTINLVVLYEKLLINFCIRNRDLSSVDLKKIITRVNNNSRKLNFNKDNVSQQDIKKVIEVDEKIIIRLKEEKNELDRIGNKLDYIESIISMFKHQILSSIENEETLVELENITNETEALNNVLIERRENKMKI